MKCRVVPVLLLCIAGFCLAIALLAAHQWRHSVAARVTCASFASQRDAQMAYRSNPTGLSALDADHDGIACESNRAPHDRTPVARYAP